MKHIIPVALLVTLSNILFASVRIATYNVKASEGLGSYGAEVLGGIGSEVVNGIARPVDILILQECDDTSFNTEKGIRGILNTLYGSGTYSYSTLSTSGYMMRIGIVYNTTTVQLVANVAFKDSAAPRSTGRYQFRIKGYGAESDLYIYNNHFKAYSGTSDRYSRAMEALRLRWDRNYGGDALPAGSNIIYAGDYNLLSPFDDAEMGDYDVTSSGGRDNAWSYLVNLTHLPGPQGTTYLSTGNGKAIDPAGFFSLTNWNTGYYKHLHTYSSGVPASRLDFQLVSSALYDGEGVSLIGCGIGNSPALHNSYRVFPNDGSHSYGGRLVDAVNSKYDRMLRYYATVFSDHLPVVADYQRPAVLAVNVAMPTESVTLDAVSQAVVTIRNAATVSMPVGADELDYRIEIISGGTLVGNSTGVDYALSGGKVHYVLLDTSTEGPTSLEVRVTSDSQGCANAVYLQSFAYHVDWQLNCTLLQLIDAWLSQEGDANWNPYCDLIKTPGNRIDLQDYAGLAEHWPL